MAHPMQDIIDVLIHDLREAADRLEQGEAEAEGVTWSIDPISSFPRFQSIEAPLRSLSVGAVCYVQIAKRV